MVPNLKILLLEDNRDEAELIQRLLKKESLDLQFCWTTNRKEFLNALEDFAPEVILSDNSLPQFNASKALAIVHKLGLNVPFILITGTVSEEFAVDIIKQGADDYILKDRLTRLPAAIDAALRRHQAQREKMAIQKQREFEHNNLKALINNTNDLMWSVDTNLGLITFNDSFNDVITTISGSPLEKGRSILSIHVTDDQLDRYKKLYDRALLGETFNIIDHFIFPDETWAEISFYPIRQGDAVIGTACFSRDITQRKKAEAELSKLEQEKLESKIEEQKKITRAMLSAQEKERNAIGIELHDNVNQILVGTNMALSMAKSNPGNIQSLITTAMNHVQEAIRENRKIAHEFVAPDLEKESLVTQLMKLASNMLETLGLEVHFDTKHFKEDLLDADRKSNVYRIAQEQCTNIVKYARATKVNFILITTADSFKMTIKDNGVGIDGNKKPTGIGLQNINGRLDLFNGVAKINSSSGNGFALEITIPLDLAPIRP